MQSHSLDLESTSSQYASITDASQTGLDLTSDFTLEAWINWETIPTSGNQSAIWFKRDGSAQGYYCFYQNSGGTLRFITQIDDTESIVNYSGFTAGVWYHLALTYDASAGTPQIVTGKQ